MQPLNQSLGFATHLSPVLFQLDSFKLHEKRSWLASESLYIPLTAQNKKKRTSEGKAARSLGVMKTCWTHVLSISGGQIESVTRRYYAVWIVVWSGTVGHVPVTAGAL